MGLGAQEEEVVTEMVSEEEGSGGEERGEPEGGAPRRKGMWRGRIRPRRCCSARSVSTRWSSAAGIGPSPGCSAATSSTLPLHFRWCPIGRLSELPSLFNEIEASQTAPFHDVMGQNFNAEPMALPEPGTSHPGAYVAYLPPLSPPVSSSSTHNAERTVDGFAYHDHWNPLAGPSYGHQSEWPRIPNVPPMAPQLVRAPGNMNEQFQHGSSSLFAGSQRSGGMRPLGAGGPAMLLPDRTFYQFPPASSGSNSMETTEDVGGNHFYSWERGHFGPHSPVNNEGPWPSSSQQQPPYAAPEPAAAPRRLFRYWGGSARPPPPENRSLDDPSFHHTRLPHM
ncbi:hypothetical protein PR202_gb20380 [Eleusine coracana subsp. coracana]|uniref:Uncharacterized protein n=1 Tax=Eleusine coracana subsp. coracana TaxID=191504 RepID=A0AAV5FA90_ELECO|nr:hypothetical protein PR202_gb20380 [Eleusine coracana subsp. coracana]